MCVVLSVICFLAEKCFQTVDGISFALCFRKELKQMQVKHLAFYNTKHTHMYGSAMWVRSIVVDESCYFVDD